MSIKNYPFSKNMCCNIPSNVLEYYHQRQRRTSHIKEKKTMADQIQLTFWNYNQFANYKPEMLRDWVNCGMTTPITPEFHMSSNEELHAKFRQMLDDAQELGVKLILQITDIYLWGYPGADAYRAKVETVYEAYGKHPAVYGFFVGEEPGADYNEYFEGIKILKEVAPELNFYMNMGSIERTERVTLKGRLSLDEWATQFTQTSKSNLIGFGNYASMITDNTGLYEHFHNLHDFVAAGKKAGADIWATMLSSAHDFYRVPIEEDYRWQLNSCIMCGCKAVVWFRLYDKLVAGDYRGSPIDEFGEKTTRYYDLARVQKRFNIHYGKVFAKLDHQGSYGIGVSYGGYPYFTVHDKVELIAAADGRSGMVSVFTDKEGNDYVALMNTFQRESCHLSLTFSDKVAKVEEIYYNGAQMDVVGVRNAPSQPLIHFTSCFAAGQMRLFKLTRA